MTYLSVIDVRRASGAPTSLISDAYITSIIAIVEKEMERWINTKFVPTEEIDIFDGNDLDRLFTRKNPLLAVRLMESNSTTISVDEIHVYKPSGMIVLGSGAETSSFTKRNQSVIIKYLYGMLDHSDTESSLSTASTAGTSVTLTVADASSFAEDDWIEIYGTDGHKEVAQITGTGTGEITVDQFVLTHSVSSKIIKLEIPYHIKRYMEIEAALYVALNAIGSTYTFNASYGLGELNVVKGVPYVHFERLVHDLLKERAMLKTRIRPRPYIVT